MGQYKHHVFLCTGGKTCPLVLRQIVQDYPYIAPPGDDKIKPDEGD